jgi:hypothetical protein
MSQIQVYDFLQLLFRANTFEESDQLQLNEYNVILSKGVQQLNRDLVPNRERIPSQYSPRPGD